MIVKCKECGRKYDVKWSTKLSDYQCDCGGELRTLSMKEIKEKNFREDESPKEQLENEESQDSTDRSSKKNPTDWINRQSKKSKVALTVGTCCVGLLLIIFISGFFSAEVDDSPLSAEQIKQKAQAIDPTVLNDNEWYPLKGKPVKFRGVAYGDYNNGILHVNAINNGKYLRVIIYGNVESSNPVSSTDIVDVYGIYTGETPYLEAADGTEIKAPLIKQAIIVPTGQRYRGY